MREVLVKFLFSFIVVYLFGNHGIAFLVGYIVGVEFMQMCYRSFKDSYRWNDLYKKPFLLLRYLKVKDTAIDLLSYIAGILIALIIKQ